MAKSIDGRKLHKNAGDGVDRRNATQPIPKDGKKLDRRSFVVATGGAMAAAALGCDDNGPNQPNQPNQPDGETGTIEVRVSGLNSTNAGSVTVTLPGGGSEELRIPLPDADTQGVSLATATGVPVGTYRITFNPPPEQIITGPDDFEDVTVLADKTVRAEFEVVGATGTLTVLVTGLAPSIPAGTVTITTLDGGDPGITITLPNSGAQGESLGTATGVPVDDYRVAYTPPNGFRASSGDSLDVTVSADQTVRADFAVVVVTFPALAFASDWSTAVGNSSTALTDGGVWDAVSGSPDHLNVISSSGLDMPAGMTNVLQVATPQNSTFKNVEVANAWELPAVGGSIWKRIYWRNGVSTAGSSRVHMLQSCSRAGDLCSNLWWNSGFPGGSTWELFLGTSKTAWPRNLHSPGQVLTYDTTYRLEWQLLRLSNNTWNVHVRMYDSNNALLYSDADYDARGNPPKGTLADNPIFTIDPQSQRETILGWQAGSDGVPGSGLFVYFGAYAVSLTGWIGPYVSGEGP